MVTIFLSCQTFPAPRVFGGMTKLTADDVSRIRAAKRSICDSTILVAVAFEVGDPDGAKAIGLLRRAHRLLNRRLEPTPGNAPGPTEYEPVATLGHAGEVEESGLLENHTARCVTV